MTLAVKAIWLAWTLSAGASLGSALPETRDESSDVGVRAPHQVPTALAAGAVALLLSLALARAPSRAMDQARRLAEAQARRTALELQEEDRRRIARDLHDGAGQALTAARLQLTALREDLTDRAAVDRVLRFVDEAMDEIRRSTAQLSPPALVELGLRGALERHCASFSEGSALTLRCEVEGELPPLDDYMEVAFYRIAQEGLHNAVRHAGASSAWVRIAASDREVKLEIGDDGTGGLEPPQPGNGLRSIAERARLVGGQARWIPRRGPGPRVEVTVPRETGAA